MLSLVIFFVGILLPIVLLISILRSRKPPLPNKEGILNVARSDMQYRYSIGYIQSSLSSYGINVKLPVFLPNIIVDSHHNDKNGKSMVFSANNSQRLELEGDFYKDYGIYAPKGYERTALQLLSPDVMALLQDKAEKFDLEVFGPQLNILCRQNPLTNPALAQNLVDIATKIIAKSNNMMQQWDSLDNDDHSKMLLLGRLQPMQKIGRRQIPNWIWSALTLVAIAAMLVLQLGK